MYTRVRPAPEREDSLVRVPGRGEQFQTHPSKNTSDPGPGKEQGAGKVFALGLLGNEPPSRWQAHEACQGPECNPKNN